MSDISSNTHLTKINVKTTTIVKDLLIIKSVFCSVPDREATIGFTRTTSFYDLFPLIFYQYKDTYKETNYDADNIDN